MNERAALMGRMLETIDAMDPEQQGHSLARGLRTASGNCMNCKNAEACARWLDEHPEGTGMAPEICLNRTLFASWKKN
ncbi:DUF6455 family protein [Roseibium limicola]|nr:DUF6455 family protein [Roseibium limicola]